MHISRRRPATSAIACAAAVAALGATLTGCGGGSSGGGTTETLTKTDLLAQANLICTAEDDATKAVKAPDDINDAKQAAAFFDKIDPLVALATSKLSALEPGSDIATDWNAFMALRREYTTRVHTVRQKADAADRSGLDDLKSLADFTSTLGAAADKVGATSCNES